TFTYVVSDGALTDTATVSITIDGVNDAPTALDDSGAAFTTDEDSSFTTGDVLTTDSDPDTSDTLSVDSIDTTGTQGQVTDNGDGTFDYDPNGQFESLAVGEQAFDTFTYVVSDGALTDTATVSITIDGVNDAPTALDDSGAAFTTGEDSSFTTGDVLTNDSDPDTSDTLAVDSIDTTGTQGQVTDNGDGTFDYDPNGQFESLAVGEQAFDTFTYVVSDGALTDTASVSITIDGANDAPTALDDSGAAFTTGEDSSFTTGDVLTNDSDPDTSDVLAVDSIDTTGTQGLVTDNGDGTFDYDPNGQFESLAVGEQAFDTFTYVVSDGALTDTATVSITIDGANDAPTATGNTYTTPEDTPVSGNVLTDNTGDGVDSDVDGDTLTAMLDDDVATGTLALGSDGSFVYTPTLGYSGVVTFSYHANDAIYDSNTALVTITVSADAPTANADGYTTPEDVTLSVPAPGVLDNDTDPNSDPLTSTLVSAPMSGTVTLDADGSFTYTPTLNYNGHDSFTYRVTDGTYNSNPATVAITVTSANDPPVADYDTFTVDEDSSNNPLDVLDGDTDIDGDALTISAVGNPDSGGMAVNGGSVVTYTPLAGFVGDEVFTYTVSDGNGGSATATVTVTVSNVNDSPVADAGGNQSADTYTTVTLDGSASSDPEGNTPLSYYWAQTGGVPVVTLSDATAQAPTFTAPGSLTVLTFTLTVTDSLGMPDSTPDQAVVTITDGDADGDGISDTTEGAGDPDGDGLPNYLDTDSDGDGIPDADEGDGDTDGDGVPDYIDLDSDGDGIPDLHEAGGGDLDSDGDGVIDDQTDTDGDGLPDVVDPDNGGTSLVPAADTDGDGTPDYLDLDSDGDGIPDLHEAGGGDLDSDGDGVIDDQTDTDGDGLPDVVDPDNGGTSLVPAADTDGDGIPDYLDLDSDGDGIWDIDEVGSGDLDLDDDGIIDDQTDTDGDGLPDVIDPDNGGTPLVPAPDSDGDGIPDYLDANDNPTISDIANQSTAVSTPINVTFTISDTDDALDGLWLYAESSNLALVNGELTGTLMLGGGISFSGSGMTRTITITPTAGMTGTTTIIVTVDDGENTASDTFVLTVGQVPDNTPPTISDIADQSTTVGTPLDVTFVISDAETALNVLGLSAASSNTTLVPLSGITFSGSGADRTATIAPTSGLTGTTVITITVSDGELTDDDVFVLTVGLHRLYLPLITRNG
ncbi:MAG: Ig-like domain-containing protein, partial [Chloroflexota bacterium]|nr:Ig-like domain-containing protein [Chloroflexota bacterium]